MRFNPPATVVRDYMARAPLALALERLLECAILRELPFNRPILDVGCGDGIFAEILFAEPLDCGVDIDPVEIARARRTGHYTELLCTPASRLEKPDGAFATVFSNSVLEHIPDLPAVLSEVLRVTRPGGDFYLTVPTDDFEKRSAGYRLLSGVGAARAAARFAVGYNRFWRHYHAYSPEGWLRLLENAGWQVVTWHRYNPPRRATTHDLLVPFGALAKIWRPLLGRWTLLPPVRRALAGCLGGALAGLASQPGRHERGALLFVHLRRNI